MISTFVEQFRQDLVYGMRALRRSPGFTFTAIAILSLGIGVNLGEINLLQALSHRINVRDVDSLARFVRVTTAGTSATFSVPAIEFYRRHNTVLSGIIDETDVQGLFQADDPDRLHCSFVSGNYFRELGIAPLYGRLLDDRDQEPGAPPVAVLGNAYWRGRFGGDASIVLKTIRLNDKPVQVVGIAPPDFGGLINQPTPVWMPLSQYPYLTQDRLLLTDFGTQRTSMFGRLKPGISFSAAEAQFRSLTAELRSQQPRYVASEEWLRVQAADTPPNPPPGAILFFVVCILLVSLVLFSACANIGNMLLARGLARQQEMDIRMAVGADRWRLIRQLMTENLLLALLASIAGLFIGRWAARILLLMIDAPYLRIVTDWKVIFACAGLGLAATLAFGLVPAFQTVKRGNKATRMRRILVSVQVSVSCVLLILSSLFTAGIAKRFRMDVTFDYPGIIVVNPEFYLHRYNPSQARQAALEIATTLQEMPGVKGVTISSFPPLTRRLWIDQAGGQELCLNAVDPSYFQMMRLPVLQGHIWGPDEPDSVAIGESAARRLWPDESPVGKELNIGDRKRIVAAVVKDSGANLIDHPQSVEAYTPISDRDADLAMVLVQTVPNQRPTVGSIRSAARIGGFVPQVDPLQSFIDSRTDTIEKTVSVVASLGAVASTLAFVGIFGLMAFTVAQRTRDIGVRRAIGARSVHVLRSVLGEYALSLGVGSIIGIAVATVAASFLHKFIFSFLPLDPVSFGAGVLLFAAVALAAIIIPAWRALQIDPSVALHHE